MHLESLNAKDSITTHHFYTQAQLLDKRIHNGTCFPSMIPQHMSHCYKDCQYTFDLLMVL